MPALKLAACKPEVAEALKKKMLLIDEPLQQDQNNNNTSANDDTFADTFAHQQKSANQDHLIQVFSQNQMSTSGPHDQFAAALLRLQADLDSASQRMSAIEAKLEASIKARQQQQRQQVTPGKRADLLSGRNLTASLVYLAWPVVVYAAMRAVERRSSRLGA